MTGWSAVPRVGAKGCERGAPRKRPETFWGVVDTVAQNPFLSRSSHTNSQYMQFRSPSLARATVWHHFHEPCLFVSCFVVIGTLQVDRCSGRGDGQLAACGSADFPLESVTLCPFDINFAA